MSMQIGQRTGLPLPFDFGTPGGNSFPAAKAATQRVPWSTESVTGFTHQAVSRPFAGSGRKGLSAYLDVLAKILNGADGLSENSGKKDGGGLFGKLFGGLDKMFGGLGDMLGKLAPIAMTVGSLVFPPLAAAGGALGGALGGAGGLLGGALGKLGLGNILGGKGLGNILGGLLGGKGGGFGNVLDGLLDGKGGFPGNILGKLFGQNGPAAKIADTVKGLFGPKADAAQARKVPTNTTAADKPAAATAAKATGSGSGVNIFELLMKFLEKMDGKLRDKLESYDPDKMTEEEFKKAGLEIQQLQSTISTLTTTITSIMKNMSDTNDGIAQNIR